MKLHEFLALTYDRERLIQFLIKTNLILSEMQCPKCNSKLIIDKNTLLFHCYIVYYEKNKHKKRIKTKCNFKTSAKIDTWFTKSKLSLEIICRLTAYFIMLRPPRQEFLCTELELSDKSVVDWISFCREVSRRNSTKLGGPNSIVEIDEAKIGKRKYNRGRIIDGKWIFGGYERDTGKIFLVPVANRTEETLLQVIEEWILPGTTIMSDCWKSYKNLNSKNFQHLTVNHSMNFVDPDSGTIYTSNI
ncbi:hypothetical protein ALC57_04950 [Trachymyrmex cornetzi]|uniref:ISXO2-like transposase domain-containing protein n=1 Tax=Trachymyrmex cornetzi TaxID=471704 RepID=A0A151JCD6_9HYME|nr:hypothetical protein ALC57_04950 [Trachymyrmex cornetzi]